VALADLRGETGDLAAAMVEAGVGRGGEGRERGKKRRRVWEEGEGGEREPIKRTQPGLKMLTKEV
jgi:hypothetical protein